jgi:methylphosphotriester-DNA--protein-cysteine methyltransferase
MYWHSRLGTSKYAKSRKLHSLIATGQIALGGYSKNKIYGMLNCSSGKRMKLENRVFFINEQEAIMMGYRPCGNCMYKTYKLWNKNQQL